MKMKKIKLIFLLAALICLFTAFAFSAEADTVIDAEVIPTSHNTISVEFTGGATFLTSTQFYVEYDAAVLEYSASSSISTREGDFASVSKQEDGRLLVNFFAATHAYKSKMLKIDFNVLNTNASTYGFNATMKNVYISKDNTGAESSVLTNGSVAWEIPSITAIRVECDASGMFYDADGSRTEPDYSTLEVTAIWSNEVRVVVPVELCTIKLQKMYSDNPNAPFDTSAANQNSMYEVTVSFKGVSDKYLIFVGVPTPSQIYVAKEPDRMSYLQDTTDAFDLTGAVIKATYPEGDFDAKLDQVIVKDFDPTVPGEQTVILEHKGKTTGLTIMIEPDIPSSIKIDKNPDLLVYKQDSVDEVMLSGIVVKAYFADGRVTTVDEDELVAAGFDPSRIGKQTITVTYRTKTATFEVEVEPLVIYPESLEIVTLPIKTNYFQNSEETLVTTGLKVNGIYADGTVENIRLNDLEFIGFDLSELGTKTITVRYFDVETSFEITVEEEPDPTDPVSLTITEPPVKRDYTRFSDEELDLTGMVLVATLANGEKVNVDLNDITVSGFDLTSDEDIQFVTIRYENITTPLIISIQANEELLFGDADLDGKLTSGDARLALRIAVGLDYADTLGESAALKLDLADYDRDGTVTSSDARSILRISVGLTP